MVKFDLYEPGSSRFDVQFVDVMCVGRYIVDVRKDESVSKLWVGDGRI